jgi:hypothetical protein
MSVVHSVAYGQAVATPLNHARIGYENFTPDSTVTATTETVDFPAVAIKNQMTFESWKPTVLPATITIAFGSSKSIGYIGVASHSLNGNTVTPEYSTDGAVWNPLDAINTPTDDSAILMLFTTVAATHVRLTITGSGTPTIAVVYVGQILEMLRPFYSGHTPAVLSRQTVIKPNKSVGGQWLGRSVLRQGLATQYEWANSDITWYEDNFETFVEAAIVAPFFIAWNILEHIDHVAYEWTSDDIAPSLSGTLDHVTFGFSAEGIE